MRVLLHPNVFRKPLRIASSNNQVIQDGAPQDVWIDPAIVEESKLIETIVEQTVGAASDNEELEKLLYDLGPEFSVDEPFRWDCRCR